jgi:hypothetical protein
MKVESWSASNHPKQAPLPQKQKTRLSANSIYDSLDHRFRGDDGKGEF